MKDYEWHDMPSYQQLPEAVRTKIAEQMQGYLSMDTEDLHLLFWEAYKDVEGVRPRWVDPSDRACILRWFCCELFPDRVEMRSAQSAMDEAYLADLQQQQVLDLEMTEDRRQLDLAYDDSLDHLDPQLSGK